METQKELACENIRSSSLFAAVDVSLWTFPPRETSTAAKSEEERMFSQAKKELKDIERFDWLESRELAIDKRKSLLNLLYEKAAHSTRSRLDLL